LDSTDSDSTGSDSTDLAEAEGHAPARVGGERLGNLSAPQRFKVEFTATEEYVRLVQEAKALLSHRAPRVTLEELQLCAMRAFVEALRKQKYGSKEPAHATAGDGSVSEHGGPPPASGDESWLGAEHKTAANLRPTRVAASAVSDTDGSRTPPPPRQRGRRIPVAVRRAVAARDAHRCTYTDSSGRRCSETQRLEFHHVVPFAVCRSHEVANLTLRCHAHNALAADQDFGPDVINERKNAARHESFSKQGP
jgi:hypothetical protein